MRGHGQHSIDAREKSKQPDMAMGILEVRQKGLVQAAPHSMQLSMLVTGRAASCGMAMQPAAMLKGYWRLSPIQAAFTHSVHCRDAGRKVGH